MEDRLIVANDKLRHTLTDSYVQMKAIADKVLPDEVSVEDFAAKSLDELNSELRSATDSLDMSGIIDKLSDGMSRVPEGTVDNPVEIQDDTKQNDVAKMSQTAFNKKLWELYSQQDGEHKAKAYQKWALANDLVEIRNLEKEEK